MRLAILRSCTSVAALGFVLATANAARADGIVLPSGGQVVAGQATIGTGPAQVTVDQTSKHAIVDWRSFSVGAGGTVAFNNGSGATLNRVTGTDMSTIAGTLSATGSVYLINQAGIVIDSGGRVLTGGSFVASTRMMDSASFLTGGDATYSGTSAGGVENKGTITAGGDVVLIGKMVVNSGTINADGTAGLIAADHIVMTAPSSNQRITVDYGDGDVTNSGVIAAATAELRAASGNVFSLAGNNGGIISVVGNATQAGRIWLGASRNIEVSGSLTAKNADGSGGTIHVLGRDIALTGSASIDASGTRGGTVLIGGDYLGGNGDRRFATETLRTADNLVFATGAVIRANAAAAGDGGNIVLWSEQTTQAHGTISARGGSLSGNGGFVETSSHNLLSFRAAVDTGATNGLTGTLLLDPRNITISNGATTAGPTFPNWDAAADSSIINVTDLQNAVTANNVIVTTGSTGSQAGNISLTSALDLTGGAGTHSLTLTAAGSITTSATITLGGNLTLNAGTDITIGAVISKNTAGAATSTLALNSGASGTTLINAQIGVGHSAAATNRTLNVNINVGQTITDQVVTYASSGALTAGVTASTGNTLIETTRANTITIGGGATLASTTDGRNTLTRNVTAKGNLTITAGATTTAASTTGAGGPPNRNVITLNYFAGGSITHTAGNFTANGLLNNSLALDVRSPVILDWRAGTTLTSSTGTFQTRGGAMSLRTVTTSPFDSTVTTGGNVSVSGLITTDGGNLTLTGEGTTATTVTLTSTTSVASALNNGNIFVTSAGSIVAGAGIITGSGTVASPTNLNFTANGGTLTINAAAAAAPNTILTQGANLNLTSSDTVTLNGAVSSTLGVVTLTSTKATGTGIAVNNNITTSSTALGNGEARLIATNNIVIAGAINTSGAMGGSTLISSGGSVTQTAAGTLTTATGLRLIGGGTFLLTDAANASANIAGNAASIAYRQANTFAVGTVTAGAGGANSVGITTTGQTQLNVTGAGALTQTAPIVAAGLLATAGGGVTLTNAANAVTGTLALSSTNTAISFTNTGNTNIGSVTGIGNIGSISGINAGTNTVTLTGTGTTSQTQAANIIGTSLLLLGTGGVFQLGSTGNDVNSIAANTGRVQFVDTDDLATAALTFAMVTTSGITSTATSANRTDYTVDLTAGAAGGATQFLTVTGTTGNITTGGVGNVRLIADRMSIVGTVNTTTADGRIVRLETFTAGREIRFGAASVDTADSNVTTTSTGTFNGLDLGNDELGRVTSNIVHIGNAASGQLRVTGAFTSPSVVLSLETGAGVDQTGAGAGTGATGGAITVGTAMNVGLGAGSLAIRGTGDINLGTHNNQVSNVAISSAGGNVRFRDDNGFAVNTVDGITTSVVSPGGLLQLVTGGAGTVTQGHSLTADNLRLGSGAALTGTYTLTNAGNNFTTVAVQAATASLTETGGFAVGTVDTLAGIAATTAATLSSTGAVTQTQIITTPLLTLNGTGGAFTLTSNNQVTALGGNTGSIDFQNTLAGGLTINNTTVATTAKITSNAAGNLVIGTNQTIASSATTGDSVVLGTNANFVANTGAAINPGTGTARYLVFTNNVGNATEWTGTVRGSLTGANFYNAPFDVAGARSAAVGTPNLTSTVTGNRFVYADQPTLLYTIMAADTKTYTGLVQNLPSTFTSGLVNGDLIGASATGAAGSTGQMANVGVYNNVTGTIGTLASPINYAFAFTGTGIQTITPALLTINVADKTKVYGDADPAFTFTVTGLQNGEAVGTALNTAGVSYTANGAGGTNITNALTRNGDNNVGGTKVITTGAGLTATSNYTIQTVNPGALTITKRDTTIVAVAKTKVYGDADPALTFTLGNLAAGDTATGVVTGALTRVAGETVIGAGPTYQINQGTLALNGNYNLTTYTPANLTITPAPLAISGTGTKAFGQADPVLTITSNGYKLGDTQGTVLTGALTRVAGETVGNYVINQGTVAANGNYTPTFTPGNFSITAAMLNLTYSITNTANVYGTLPTVGTVTLTGIQGGDVVTPVITVRNSLAQTVNLATTTGVGTYTASVTGLAGAQAGNYVIANAGNTNGTITVSPAPLVVNVASFAKVYGDADPAFTFTVTGIQNGEAVGAALNGSGTTYTANGAGGTNITNALTRNGDNNVGGTKVITTGAGLTATANYTIQTVNPGALTITKRDTTIVAVAKTKVYGDTDPALTFTLGNLAAGDTATGVTTGALTRVAGETVIGTGPNYQINQGTVALNGNYNLTTYTPANLTITAAPLTITAAAATKVYGATDPALTFSTTGLKLTDTVGTVVTGALARAAGETVAAGPYAINQGSVAANGNYAITYAGNNLTITPAPLTVAVNAATKIYGDTDPTFAFTTTGLKFTDTAGTALTGAVTRAVGETVAGGPYAISQGTLASNPNYALTFTGNNLAITPRAATIVAVAKTKVYGDADPALTFTVANLATGDTATGVSTGALTRVAGENVAPGPYQINQGTVALNSNYSVAGYTPANLTITPAPLAVNAVAATRIYGQADPQLGFLSSGYKFTDTATSVLTGTVSRTAGSNVGAYPINQGTVAANPNYAITYTPANLTITPAPLTVTGTGTKIFGQADPVLTPIVTGLVNNDTQGQVLTGALTRAPGENAGMYTINQGTIASNPNYNLVYVPGTFTINPAGISFTVNYSVANSTSVYGTLPAPGAVTLTGVVGADIVTPVITVTNAQNNPIVLATTTGVGTYTASVTGLTGANAGNYILAAAGNTNGTITVTPAPLVLTLGNKTKVYGDADPALTFTVAGIQNGEAVGTALAGAGTLYTANGAGGTNVTTALTRVAGENVATGPYAISKGAGLTATANYSIQTIVPGALTITPAPLAVSGTATKIYGQPDPVLTVTSTGYKLTDTPGTVLTGALARAPGTNVGTYSITQGTLVSNPNYVVNYTPGALAITPATLTYAVGNTTNVYGTLPTIGTTVLTGIVAGDTVNPAHTVTNSQNATVTLATNTNVGTYGAAVTSLTGASAGNYVLAATGNTNGTIRVTPATLTVSPAAATKVYGSPDPALPFTFAGLVGGDPATVLTGLLGRAAGENAGPYNFTNGTLNAGPNYVIALAPPGPVFTITPKPITFSVADTTSVYGTLGTRGAATFAGVLAGDVVTPVYAPVTNSQNAAVTLATNTPVGPYGVTLSGVGGAAGGNYVLATAGNRAGTLTVTRAPLTLVIDNSIRPVSTPNPTFTFTANGLVGGDTAAALISQNPADAGANRLAVSSVANLMSPAGAYPIVASGLLANYALTVVPGQLTVTAVIQPEPPVAPGTSGGSISPTGLNYAGGAATITAIVADPGAPKADDGAVGELVRREDSNKAFNIYIEVVPEAVAQTAPTFGGLGTTEIAGGNNAAADIVSTSSFDPPVANDNADDEARRRSAARPGTGR